MANPALRRSTPRWPRCHHVDQVTDACRASSCIRARRQAPRDRCICPALTEKGDIQVTYRILPKEFRMGMEGIRNARGRIALIHVGRLGYTVQFLRLAPSIGLRSKGGEIMKRLIVIAAALLTLSVVYVATAAISSASVCQPDGTGCTMAGTYPGPNALINSDYGGFRLRMDRISCAAVLVRRAALLDRLGHLHQHRLVYPDLDLPTTRDRSLGRSGTHVRRQR